MVANIKVREGVIEKYPVCNNTKKGECIEIGDYLDARGNKEIRYDSIAYHDYDSELKINLIKNYTDKCLSAKEKTEE